jgi:hypothetical protein
LRLFYASSGVCLPTIHFRSHYAVPKAKPFVHGIGAFDVVAEFWPHLAIILYRLYPGRHSLSYRLFIGTMIAELVGTTLETVVVFWLWGSLWDQWTIPFKVVTPILHALFSAAQLFGAWVFWQLARKEKLIMNGPKQ